MESRHLGRTGLRISSVGLGCNNFGWTIDEAASQAVVDRALDLGVTVFDTAASYGKSFGASEVLLGRMLRDRRKNITLITKFGLTPSGAGTRRDSSRAAIMQGVEASLRRLRTDWIDVYMLHWPDPETPIGETLGVLDDLVHAGKVRYVACSNLEPWKLADSVWISRHEGLERFVAAENHYNVLVRDCEKDLLPTLAHYGLGLLPYFPLASGMLTGKYSRLGGKPAGRLTDNFLRLGDTFMTERNFEIVEDLEAFAKERGRTLLGLAISWLLANPLVSSVICGATKPEQVEQNIMASGWAMTSEDLARIDQITGLR